MKTINPEILEKLQKILRLAKDAAAQPGEVEAAMAKAKALAIQHNLELSSIDLSTEQKAKDALNIEQDASLKTNSKYRRPYHRYIFSLFEMLFGVRVICSTYYVGVNCVIAHIYLIGEQTDLILVKALFPYLQTVFPATLRALVRAGHPECAATINGCYRGLYEGILDANKREEAKLDATQQACYALVLRRKEDLVVAKVSEVFPHLRSSKARARQFSGMAYTEGYAKGKQIHLNQLNGTC